MNYQVTQIVDAGNVIQLSAFDVTIKLHCVVRRLGNDLPRYLTKYVQYSSTPHLLRTLTLTMQPGREEAWKWKWKWKWKPSLSAKTF